MAVGEYGVRGAAKMITISTICVSMSGFSTKMSKKHHGDTITCTIFNLIIQ